MKPIKPTRLHWDADTPMSDIYNDIYFTKDGGLEETEHVFIQGNRLTDRFAHLPVNSNFVIAEMGFGTGLNFLVARQHWLTEAHPSNTLHFISFEKHPLEAKDMDEIWSRWSTLTDCKQAFLDQYPPLIEGFHHLFFDQGRIQLTLILGDILDQIGRLKTQVDAWFLDGFAPSKNPDMWRTELYHAMATLSHSATTLATYTVAQQVREGLTQAGFRFSKSPGFGHKRYILTGTVNLTQQDNIRQQTIPRSVIVVGAGLAGASTARALADAGVAVTLIESMPEPAQQGSGNAQGALYAKLAVKPTPETALHLHGLLYSSNRLRQLSEQNPALVSLCGVLQLATNDKERKRQQQLIESAFYPESLITAVSSSQASAIMGTETPFTGVFFANAGWVAPADYCRWLIDHPLIQCHFNQTVTAITQDNYQCWELQTESSTYTSDYVVICTAAEAKKLDLFEHLPIKPIRGQTSHVEASDRLPTLNTVVCGDGYISPPKAGAYCFGATFDLHYQGEELRDTDHQKNLSHLIQAIPAFDAVSIEDCSGRTGFRCSTADYLPIVGQATDVSSTLEQFAGLRHDARSCDDLEVPRLKGLYLNIGHGSKGLITCPISAAHLVSLMNLSPDPLPKDLAKRLDTSRFILRDLSRRRI